MNHAVIRAALSQRLLPFLDWLPTLSRDTLRHDVEAGVIGAILILPQAIALATLAGMPPEYGVYTSIFPVIIASLWGSSWHTLSGPNTAVCVMIAFSVAPFASVGTEYYVAYVLALTFMVGVIQLVMGVFRLGVILDFISHTVIQAIVFAVGLIMIVSAASAFLGVLSNLGEPFFIRIYQVVHDVSRANPYAVAVGVVTVATGLFMRPFLRRYALVIAVFAGTFFSVIINYLFGPATTEIELLGQLSLSLLPLSAPSFNLESMYVIKELVTSALAIAFLGLMQTVVISRSIANKTGQHIDNNQEIVGQGLSNLVAPFLSSFAGSGSFNRSAAHYQAGARTPMAGVYASLILGMIVLVGVSVIAYMPMAAVAGALILVGYGLIDLRDIKNIVRSRQETIIYFLTLSTALIFGLNSGVFVGLLLSLIIYMWYAATPNIEIEEYTARNGRLVQAITIDGNLFFGSVRHVEKALERLADQRMEQGILLLRTDHLTYLDASGANLIAEEMKRQQESGGDVYVYVTRGGITEVLEKAGVIDSFGEDRVIRKDLSHPMKDVLYPYSPLIRVSTANKTENDHIRGKLTMETLAKRMRTTRLLGPLSLQQITTLLEESPVRTAPAGDIIIKENTSMDNHLILLEGAVEAQRTWSVEDSENDKSYTWTIEPSQEENSFCFLSAASNKVRVRALSDVRYILINADAVDEMVGWSQHFARQLDEDPQLRRRMNLIRETAVFHQLPLENVKAAFDRLKTREVKAGEAVATQGEEGDAYFIIEEGEAEVVRTDPFTDETKKVAVLSAGDAFGEEALLQGGYRNATVTMTTPGRLLVLNKSDFDELVKSSTVTEINAEQAHAELEKGKKQLIDCRYDMEYEESRIAGARFVPLDQIRLHVHSLDPDVSYIVYCRSGRRSKAAAFLLRERNIDAVSLAGGIKDWPFEIDTSPIDAMAAGS